MAEGSKSESRAPGLQGGDDLGEVVADETESCVLCELLYH